MISFSSDDQRLILGAFLLVSLFPGCKKVDKGTPSTETPAVSDPLTINQPKGPTIEVGPKLLHQSEKLQARAKPITQKATPVTGIIASPKNEKNRPAMNPKFKLDDTTLSEDEKRELATLMDWVNKEVWTAETNPEYRRQRPVGLIVLRPDGLPGVIPSALKYADSLAHVGWDVKFLLHKTGIEKRDFDALKALHAGIDKINAGILHRNKVEEGKLPVGTAPLRPLSAPELFADVQQIKNAIDVWLANHFVLPIRSPSEVEQGVVAPRPPFGGINFSGHGRTVRLNPAGPKEDPNLIDQFKVSDVEWYDLENLDTDVLLKYQAPVWIMTDFCRNTVKVERGDLDVIEFDACNLEPRKFDNIEQLSAEIKSLVRDCEALRANVSIGYMYRRGKGVTRLRSTEFGVRVDDTKESTLQYRIGELLQREDAPNDIARANFNKRHTPIPINSLTLSQVKEFTTKMINSGKRPGLSRGTLSDEAVVYTTLRGKDAYPAQFPNLLRGGVKLFGGGFFVPELAVTTKTGNLGHFGPITLIRKQDSFDSNFKTVFEFNAPFSHTPGSQDLILRISASSPFPNDTLKFHTGVLSSPNSYLNLKQFNENYAATDSLNKGVKCDGTTQLIRVPLTGKDTKISIIEIASYPNGAIAEKGWNKGASLTIHGVYLLPSLPSDQQLNALETDIKRVEANTTFDKMCIWVLPLHANPESVLPPRTGLKGTVIEQTVKSQVGLWGMAAEVYPKMYIESDTRQLRLKIEVDPTISINEMAEIGLIMYSGNMVMGARSVKLSDAITNELVIPIKESGMIQEVVAIVRNYPGQLTITEMILETTPK